MIVDFVQVAIRKDSGHASRFAHFGPCGLFFLAILDSSPVPTFGGLDIVLAILVGTHRSPWYLCAALATVGSVLGAYITFLMARRAGSSYLQTKFGNCKLSAFLNIFEKWGTGALAASTAIPFPFPTSLFFAAAGASPYRTRTFLMVVTLCRGARYSVVALLAYNYGRQFIHVIRHPALYWGRLLLFAVAIGSLVLLSTLLNKRLETAPHKMRSPPCDPHIETQAGRLLLLNKGDRVHKEQGTSPCRAKRPLLIYVVFSAFRDTILKIYFRPPGPRTRDVR